jgi:hypothetical protein
MAGQPNCAGSSKVMAPFSDSYFMAEFFGVFPADRKTQSRDRIFLKRGKIEQLFEARAKFVLSRVTG